MATATLRKAAPSSKAAAKAPSSTKAKVAKVRKAPAQEQAAPPATTARTSLPEHAWVTLMFYTDGKLDNPKRSGSAAHRVFAKYLALHSKRGEQGFNVADLLDAGVPSHDIRYNITHGYIEVEGVTVKDGKVIVQ